MKFIVALLLITLFSQICYPKVGEVTGLEIPRYISLKSNDANIRVGPSINYPIVLKYIKKNYPLEVIEEYEEWRKIKDFKNNTGWIHKSLISGDRTGIIISKENIKSISILNTIDGKIIGIIGKGNIVELKKCKINWCFIEVDNFKGWVRKKNIWGVKEKEIFKITFYQKFEDFYWWSINEIDRLKTRFQN